VLQVEFASICIASRLEIAANTDNLHESAWGEWIIQVLSFYNGKNLILYTQHK
jgi:hypothetical protein